MGRGWSADAHFMLVRWNIRGMGAASHGPWSDLGALVRKRKVEK